MAEGLSAVNKAYELDLDINKKNVFVTQLHDRDDEDDVTAFPVVKETGDKLIETGINTLQRTLLLKKEVEVDRVQAELEAKRHEFKQRMDLCAQRQIEIQKKQQKMKDRVSKFEGFLKENELKRRRAIQKYQTEVKLKEQKTKELEQLEEELYTLRETMTRLENKVNRYRIFEEYLLRVIDVMPEDYLAASDDKMKGLMSRHRTLSDSNHHLVNKLISMGDELETLRGELADMQADHNKQVVSINSELSRLQQKQEVESAENQKNENKYNAAKGGLREKRTEFGVITMAIDNIAEICHKRLDIAVEEMSLEQKLHRIRRTGFGVITMAIGKVAETCHKRLDIAVEESLEQKLHRIRDYVNDREDVAKMSQPDQEESPQGSRRESVDYNKKLKPKIKKKVTLNG